MTGYIYSPLNTQASITNITNPKNDQNVENSGDVGEIDFKKEFTVLINKADVKQLTAATAKTTDGVLDMILISI